MKILSIQWLMILLIATQSVWSMADAHSTHQSGIEHLEFQHDHTSKIDTQDSTSQDEQSPYDCHHCCHCHGAHPHFISNYIAPLNLKGQSPQHSFSKPFRVSLQVQPLYRPPRA